MFQYATGFNCMYTNADSLINKFPEFKTIVTNTKPLIIAVTEFKPKNSRYALTAPELALQDYDMFHTPLEDPDGRGCIIYTHKDLKATEVTMKGQYRDHVWCAVRLNNHDELLVGCIYRSPNSNSASNEHLNEILKESSMMNVSHVLLMGDFNYPQINWESWDTTSQNPQEASYKFIEAVRDAYLFQHVKKPTRARRMDAPHILDLIMTNEEGMVSDLEYWSPLGKSDHSCLHFKFHCYLHRKVSNQARYNYNRANWPSIKADLDIDWQETFHETTTTDQKWKIVASKINEAVMKHIPKVTIGGGHKSRFTTPLSQKVLSKIRKKHRAWQRFIETREGEKHAEFCRLRNQVRKLTRQAQIDHETSIASQAKANPKKFWNYAKQQTKTKPGISDLETELPNGEKKTTKNDQEKVEVLNSFFASVFTNEVPGPIPNFEPRPFTDILSTINITTEDVKAKLSKLNPTKSPGPDNIGPRILKEMHEVLAKPLADMYRSSLQEGQVPQQWKEANVSAIHKKGSRKVPENYRPVSLTSVTCKVMESIIRDKMFDHMNNNDLFSTKQFGFISGRSTALQLLRVLDEWTEILDDRGSLDAIYMDYMKAFDKVPHRRLLTKLAQYGIRGDVLAWIQEYLSNRKQRVVINGVVSGWRDVVSGIPQGSVLGPLLFVIYINDLPDILEEGTQTYLFADDTKLYRRIRSIEDCQSLQRDLDALAEWSDKWLLKFHPKKCKVLEVGTRQSRNYGYKLQGVLLEHVESEKDIGVVVDSQLKFSSHISTKINKANSVMGVIRRSFKALNSDTFKKLFVSLVRPHVEYANSVWSPYLKKDVISIENVQRRATKQIPGFRDLTYKERLTRLKLPTLAFRRLRGDMIETYKILNNIYDSRVTGGLLDLYVNHIDNPERIRGHTLKLFKRRARLNTRQKFFSHRVVDTWNSLPQNVVSAPSLRSFERRLDRWWSDQDLFYDFTAVLKLNKNRHRPGGVSSSEDSEEDLDT